MISSHAWYVAYTKSCMERKVMQELEENGVAAYVPIQKELRQWSDRKKWVDRLVIPGMVFIRTTETQRPQLLARFPALTRFMGSRRQGPFRPAVVPDVEMERFRQMVSRSSAPVTLAPESLQPGDLVRIVRGSLTGLECELVCIGGRHTAAVRLGLLGAATVEIGLADVEKSASKALS